MDVGPGTNETDQVPPPVKKKQSRRAQSEVPSSPSNHVCGQCGKAFPSRAEMYRHIVKEEHQVPEEKRITSPEAKASPVRSEEGSAQKRGRSEAPKWQREFVVPDKDKYRSRSEVRQENPHHTEDRAARRERREQEREALLDRLPRARAAPAPIRLDTQPDTPPRRGRLADQWSRWYRSQAVPSGSHRGRGSVADKGERKTTRVMNFETGEFEERPVRGRSVDREPWDRARHQKEDEEQDAKDIAEEEAQEDQEKNGKI